MSAKLKLKNYLELCRNYEVLKYLFFINLAFYEVFPSTRRSRGIISNHFLICYENISRPIAKQQEINQPIRLQG